MFYLLIDFLVKSHTFWTVCKIVKSFIKNDFLAQNQAFRTMCKIVVSVLSQGPHLKIEGYWHKERKLEWRYERFFMFSFPYAWDGAFPIHMDLLGNSFCSESTKCPSMDSVNNQLSTTAGPSHSGSKFLQVPVTKKCQKLPKNVKMYQTVPKSTRVSKSTKKHQNVQKPNTS